VPIATVNKFMVST